jgi:DNA-binding CsgD family transcriptional regulator
MISIKEYAKKHKISERTARKQLDRKVELGVMNRQKGSKNSYVYYEPKHNSYKWHDPFNKCRAKFNSFKGDKWPLMPRQRLIFHLCNIGLQRKEIAEIMGVTVLTLQKHIDRVYKKLGVNTREDAIKKAIMR